MKEQSKQEQVAKAMKRQRTEAQHWASRLPPGFGLLCLLLLLWVALLPSLVPSAHAATHTARPVNETCTTASYTSDGNPFSLCPGPYPGGGNCVWWAWEQWHRLGYDLPLTWGNAADWIVDAEQAGLPLGTTPRVAAIAVFPVADGVWAYGSPGHVAFVTRVSPDGNSFDVTYQNYGDSTPMYIGTNYQVSVINQPRYQRGLLRFLYFPVPLDASRFTQLPGITAQDIAALPVRANISVSSLPSSSPSFSSSTSTTTTSLLSSTTTEPVTTTDAETLPAGLVVPPMTKQQSIHGDFTGTGTNDLLLYNRQEGRLDVLVLTPSSQDALPRRGKQPVYRMDEDGQAVLTSQLVSLSDATTGATGWGSSLTILIGDVTHAGRDEIVLYDMQAGTLQVLTLNEHRAIEQHRVFSGWGTGWQMSMGRFDGQHQSLLLYRPVRTAMPSVPGLSSSTSATPSMPTASATPASSPSPTPGATETTPVPLLTETPAPIATSTPSSSPSPVTASETPTAPGTPFPTPTGTGTPSPLLSPTLTATSSPTAIPTMTPTMTPTPTALPSPTTTATPTPTPSSSPTPQPSPTPSPTPLPSPTPTETPTPPPTPSADPQPTATPTSSPSPVPTATPLPSPTATGSATPTVGTQDTQQTQQTALFAPSLPDTDQRASQSPPLPLPSSNVWLVTFDATGTPRVQCTYTLWNANWEFYTGHLTDVSHDDVFIYDRTSGEGHLLLFDASLRVQHETLLHGLQGNWLVTMGDFSGAGTAQLFLYDPTQGTARMLAFARNGSIQQHQDYSHLGTHELVYTGYFGLPTMSVMLHDPTQGQSLFLSFDHQLALSHELRMQTWGTRWQVLVGSFLSGTTSGCTDTPPCSTGETRETTGATGTHDDLLVLDRQTGQLEPFAISLAHIAHRFDPRVTAFERLGVAPTLQARPVETRVVSLAATLETSIRNEEVY